MRSAEFYHSTDGGDVCCDLCPHRCVLQDGRSGICRVRRAEGGMLLTDAYGRLSAEHVDPIEKKPLYHFYPGSRIYSIGGWGCNFCCSFCQNWTISQRTDFGRLVGPMEVVERARRSGGIGVAYTYNEPLIAFEFVRDCSELAHEHGLKNVLVTNGYLNPVPAAELLPLIDAVNVDIKSMDDDFYRRLCGGRLRPVLDFVKQAVECGCHTEITNLLIPGLNDSEESIISLAQWVADNLGCTTPSHISAYFPNFELRVPPTSRVSILEACRLAEQFLDNVHPGNV